MNLFSLLEEEENIIDDLIDETSIEEVFKNLLKNTEAENAATYKLKDLSVEVHVPRFKSQIQKDRIPAHVENAIQTGSDTFQKILLKLKNITPDELSEALAFLIFEIESVGTKRAGNDEAIYFFRPEKDHRLLKEIVPKRELNELLDLEDAVFLEKICEGLKNVAGTNSRQMALRISLRVTWYLMAQKHSRTENYDITNVEDIREEED